MGVPPLLAWLECFLLQGSQLQPPAPAPTLLPSSLLASRGSRVVLTAVEMVLILSSGVGV